ncbi:hypothetical protein OG439_03235 [Amycolatopsis sp. NBC_01307]|nr:hypothetical protein OG439_03235 [Amycolatopsis sp. NBC_01307]
MRQTHHEARAIISALPDQVVADEDLLTLAVELAADPVFTEEN